MAKLRIMSELTSTNYLLYVDIYDESEISMHVSHIILRIIRVDRSMHIWKLKRWIMNGLQVKKG